MQQKLLVLLAAAAAGGALPAAAETNSNGLTELVRSQAAIDSALPAPDKPLVYVEPSCPGPGCPDFDRAPTPTAKYRRIVFLNFDGATIRYGSEDATQNKSRILRFDSRVIPPFEKEHLNPDSVGSLTRQQIIDMTVDNVRFHMMPYDVEVVTERPATGDYHMIMFSGVDDCETIAGANCAGIAPLDCYDDNGANIVWVFAGGLRVSDLATTSSHEAAHALGVFHTLDTDDIMFPSILGSIPDHFGAGNVPDGDYNCQGNTFQDSNELLLDTIGMAPPDSTGPTVEITQPAAGITIGPGSMIEARVDDRHSAIAEVEFFLNGVSARALTRDQRPWVLFLGPSQDTGPLTIRAVATDLAGNTSETSVDVQFEKGGNTPCTTNEQCDAGFECNGLVCVKEDPDSGALGDVCVAGDECQSGFCVPYNGEQRCSQPCDDSGNSCPDGFSCVGGGGCWPADGGDGGGGGCNATDSSSTPLIALMFFAAVFFARRRRYNA